MKLLIYCLYSKSASTVMWSKYDEKAFVMTHPFAS